MATKREFYSNKYYHIYNRGVDKRIIFQDKGDLYYFFDAIQIANSVEALNSNERNKKRRILKENKKDNEKLVEIIAYSLLPNHFHFILKQKVENGISKFMSKISNSYTKYFNKKYERSGVLFQGRFKSKDIDGELGREIVSAYINLNYKHHNHDIKKDLVKTSLFEFLGEEEGDKICSQKEIKYILDTIGGIKEYKEFLKNKSKYFSEKHNQDFNNLKFNELER